MSKSIKDMMISYFINYPITLQEKYLNNPRKLKQLKRRKIYAIVIFLLIGGYISAVSIYYHRNMIVYTVVLVLAILLLINVLLENKYIKQYVYNQGDPLEYGIYDKRYNQETLRQFKELDNYDLSKITKIDQRYIHFDSSKVYWSSLVRIDTYDSYTILLFQRTVAVVQNIVNKEYLDELVKLTNLQPRKIDIDRSKNKGLASLLEEDTPKYRGMKFDLIRKVLSVAIFIGVAFLVYQK